MVDRLGMPVDPGIRGVVVALNSCGIYTTASCEGHLERGLAYPWVDIETREAAPLAAQSAQKLRAAQRALPDSVLYTRLIEEAERIEHDAKRLVWQAVPRLTRLLEQFYQSRPLDYERHLILDTRRWAGSIRLQSQGAEFQDVLDAATQAARLAAFREEMDAFAAFLKAEFFNFKGE